MTNKQVKRGDILNLHDKIAAVCQNKATIDPEKGKIGQDANMFQITINWIKRRARRFSNFIKRYV